MTFENNFSSIFENALDVTPYFFFQNVPLPELGEFDLCSSLPLFQENYMAPQEDAIDTLIRQLRELRVRLGFTQTELSDSITALCGRKISQTTICRFEGRMLTARNMRKLAPTFEEWIRLAKMSRNEFVGRRKIANEALDNDVGLLARARRDLLPLLTDSFKHFFINITEIK
ncbi:Oidioi.mRNA.OKI2018_I69.PAR.g8653.t1.cds [Oikopleura dioica]|uniref:Oidioi.mRNA.OKI2018_I69.PAR.g8653.t1.cds n=1 Tax=Oikopleura dioica TaxID=34765 RepID=A0ABN7RLH5_OIKDI|nr:Oidioi.mRNA.OKI2018_I69.PAR.g8653.t1.cds [Oikopleura dioica]